MEQEKEKKELNTLIVTFEKVKLSFKYNSFYKTHEIGDLVVVYSPDNYKNRLGEYNIGKVKQVLETAENGHPLIIQKVSFVGYNKNQPEEEIKPDQIWNRLTEEKKKEIIKDVSID